MYLGNQVDQKHLPAESSSLVGGVLSQSLFKDHKIQTLVKCRFYHMDRFAFIDCFVTGSSIAKRIE